MNEDIKRAIRFVIIACGAVSIQFITLFVMEDLLKIDYWTSYIVGLILSVIFNFTMNRNYNFHSKIAIKKGLFLVILFYLVFTPLSTWGGQVLVDNSWNSYLVLVLTVIANVVLEFFYYKWVVFAKTDKIN